ncbi:hypothetical protein [Nocardiopsis sp. FR4]|uniref:hypothetical protein n=1 Tax=Nocardiopsis sp. FR4 TaxID=2605985 RepID=UPI001F2A162F|nr:hypothetical protein [Nocardiopsis sp. FR4]
MSTTFALVCGASFGAFSLTLLIAREADKSWPMALLIAGGSFLGALSAFGTLASAL